MANERYPLTRIMFDDLLNRHKVAMILFILVIISAISTVWITHQTRLLTAQHSQILHENHKLNNQYTHLQLEENSISQKSRLEAVADKLKLQHIQKEQEMIILR